MDARCVAGERFIDDAYRLVKLHGHEHPTKQALWEICQGDEQCVIPTKSQLADALKLLRQRSSIKTLIASAHPPMFMAPRCT